MGNTTIEINGKRYDARTGELLGEGAASAPPKHTASRQNRTIDGFSHPRKANTAVHQGAQIKDIKKSPAVQSRKSGTSIAVTKVASGHKPQHSQTLMRHIVPKPSFQMKTPIKTTAPSELAAAPKSDVAVPTLKLSAHNVDEHRLARARSAERNQHIKRFTSLQQNQPAHRAHAVATAPTTVRQTTHRPLAASQTASTQSHKESQHSNIFEAAIANAKSHEQPAHKVKQKAGRRIIQITSMVAAFLLISGFVAYMNMPNIELRIASARAGFHAQLPDYKPTGYALDGGVKATNGIVSVSFRSGSSGFTLQQQESNWDSQTLLDNVVAIADKDHKTYQSQGRTVYIYGNNASWVNGGVLYSMKINGDLSHQDIVSVATSM